MLLFLGPLAAALGSAALAALAALGAFALRFVGLVAVLRGFLRILVLAGALGALGLFPGVRPATLVALWLVLLTALAALLFVALIALALLAALLVAARAALAALGSFATPGVRVATGSPVLTSLRFILTGGFPARSLGRSSVSRPIRPVPAFTGFLAVFPIPAYGFIPPLPAAFRPLRFPASLLIARLPALRRCPGFASPDRSEFAAHLARRFRFTLQFLAEF